MRIVVRRIAFLATFALGCGGDGGHPPAVAGGEAATRVTSPPVPLGATEECATVVRTLGVARADDGPLLATVQPVPWSTQERDVQIAALEERVTRGRDLLPTIEGENLREVATTFVDALARHRDALGQLTYAAKPTPAAPPPPTTAREAAAREAIEEGGRALLAVHDGPFLRDEPKFRASHGAMVEALIPLWRICEP